MWDISEVPNMEAEGSGMDVAQRQSKAITLEPKENSPLFLGVSGN